MNEEVYQILIMIKHYGRFKYEEGYIDGRRDSRDAVAEKLMREDPGALDPWDAIDRQVDNAYDEGWAEGWAAAWHGGTGMTDKQIKEEI